MQTIFTLGYEGANIDDFIETLRIAGINTLVDIRALPLSRKRGFSKRALAEQLQTKGIQYIHVPALGDPKPGRDAARAGELSKFRRIFARHLRLAASRLAIEEVARLADDSKVCLLCFERDHDCCHRSLVAEAIVEVGNFRVKHMKVHCGLRPSELRHATANRRLAVG